MSDDTMRQIDKLRGAVINAARVILYTDRLGYPNPNGERRQAQRDDLWAISTKEVDKIESLISSEVVAVLEELEHDIHHKIRVTNIQGYAALTNGQYIKVPNMESALTTIKQRYQDPLKEKEK